VACSRRLIRELDSTSDWGVVYNAVDVDRYAFTPTVPADAPLVFLGRIEAIKGPHVAIAVARRANRRLILAGNVLPGQQTYFDREIRPHLDGDLVTYTGPVDDDDKSRLLSQAGALLMPVLWEEPFGIVMAEALACGTPVIGFARGAVPEVVDHGVTGSVCRDECEMDLAVAEVGSLSRAACRRSAEERFSQRALVDGYEAIYETLIEGRQGSPRLVEQPELARRRL
jgi:glycosyltransferase involved in cell wall biosynthesis